MVSLAIALAIALAACGNSEDGSTAATEPKGNEGGSIIYRPKYNDDKIAVGALKSPEQQLLGEILAQTYETAGFDVGREFNLGSIKEAQEALRSGAIVGFPEGVASILTSRFAYKPRQIPRRNTAAFELARKELLKEGLTNLGPTEFTAGEALAISRSRAEQSGIETISDLRAKMGNPTIYGPRSCAKPGGCLVLLRQAYGLKPQSFHPIASDRRFGVLDEDDSALSVVTTTDPRLYAERDRYLILRDDRHALPASGMMMVTREGLTTKWFPDFTKWNNWVEQGLTLPIMQELKARVELDGESPAAVAADYLESAGFVG